MEIGGHDEFQARVFHDELQARFPGAMKVNHNLLTLAAIIIFNPVYVTKNHKLGFFNQIYLHRQYIT